MGQGPPPFDVNVINDAAKPASVLIENDVINPIPIVDIGGSDEFMREPFFLRVGAFHDEFIDYVVPDGKILVIEWVKVDALNVPCDFTSRGRVSIRPPGFGSILNDPAFNEITFPLQAVLDPCSTVTGLQDQQGAMSLRVYARPQYELAVYEAVSAGQTTTFISGYLVPANSPTLAP